PPCPTLLPYTTLFRALPLPADEGQAALRAGRPARRRPDPGGALLGADPAGLLQEGRRLAAQPRGRAARHPDDRGRRRHREPARRSEEHTSELQSRENL